MVPVRRRVMNLYKPVVKLNPAVGVKRQVLLLAPRALVWKERRDAPNGVPVSEMRIVHGPGVYLLFRESLYDFRRRAIRINLPP